MTTRISTPEDIADTFRASMRVFAAGVSLVTSRDEHGDFHGMAVTSSTSLSLDPPSMLVAVNRSASVYPVMKNSGLFCINILTHKHAEILANFSRSDLRHLRFSEECWFSSDDGLPILGDALAAMLCVVEESHDFGSHTVFFGRVKEVRVSNMDCQEDGPIIWMNGAAKSLAL